MTLKYLGKSLSSIGQYEKAMKSYQDALAIFQRRGETTNSAFILADLALLSSQLGEFEKAYDYSEKALTLTPEEDQGARANILFIRARTDQRMGKLARAAATMEEVLAISESSHGLDQGRLHSTYFPELNEYYDSYVHLLMSLSEQEESTIYAARALEVSERTRARNLIEALAASQQAKAQSEPVERLNLRKELEEQDRRLRHLWGTAASEEEIRKAELELMSALQAYERQHADFTSTQWSAASLRQIQEDLLDADSLLLVFTLGQERSFLWAVDREEVNFFELPDRRRLESQALHANELFKSGDPNFDLTAAFTAAELGDELLGPAAHLLGNRRLLIVADGALQRIPFAALRLTSVEGGLSEPLLATHEIISLPSASVGLALRRVAKMRQPPAKLLAIFADPVLSRADPRLPVVIGDDRKRLDDLGLERLPHSSEEAMAIFALATLSGESSLAQGFAANAAAVKRGRLSEYRILHFATHSLFDTEQPQLSGVVLSQFDASGKPIDGMLRLHEIQELDLAAELVTLSACETSLGREFRGEGALTLAHSFLQAGALSVVASLWAVDDQATSELMKSFYHGLLRRNLPPAAALREAQLSLRENPRWRAPYYWAGFVLQGEWQRKAHS